MAGRAETARENGKKGGRPKGSKSQNTLAKEAAREHVRQRITAELDPIIDAALQRAKGLSYLVTRDAKTGKFVRVTRATLASTQTAIEVWEKEPDMAAIRELLDRALDKSKEQSEVDVHMQTDWNKFIEQVNEARRKLAEDKRRKGEK